MGTADRDKSGSSKKRYDGQLMSGMGLPRFVERTAALLDLERNAEKEEALRALESKTAESTRRAVARGRCLRSLRCTHVEGGLLGRSLVTLERASPAAKGQDDDADAPGRSSHALPAHTFHPHDIVAVRPSKADPGCAPLFDGVVYRVRDASITVAVDSDGISDDANLSQSLRLEKLANEVTHTRLSRTLERMSKCSAEGEASGKWGSGRLLACAFGSATPAFDPNQPAPPFFSSSLDASQRAAVRRCLAAQDLAMIHGPPGTGKTTTVVELILQVSDQRARMPACLPPPPLPPLPPSPSSTEHSRTPANTHARTMKSPFERTDDVAC